MIINHNFNIYPNLKGKMDRRRGQKNTFFPIEQITNLTQPCEEVKYMSIIMHQRICFNVSVIRKNANETRPELM